MGILVLGLRDVSKAMMESNLDLFNSGLRYLNVTDCSPPLGLLHCVSVYLYLAFFCSHCCRAKV
jgi:hypothetical protein